jgi:drug/metabolite transporter (DMT)-like permease
LGYTFMLISLVFNGFFYAYEQYLMKKHTINPLQMVGCEGIFGMVIVTFIALVLSITPCHFE